jgi:hypothetical protein
MIKIFSHEGTRMGTDKNISNGNFSTENLTPRKDAKWSIRDIIFLAAWATSCPSQLNDPIQKG